MLLAMVVTCIIQEQVYCFPSLTCPSYLLEELSKVLALNGIVLDKAPYQPMADTHGCYDCFARCTASPVFKVYVLSGS